MLKRSIFSTALFCVFAVSLNAQLKKLDTLKQFKYIVLPTAYYTPETSWAFGLSGIKLFDKDENDLIKPKAFIVLNDNYEQSKKLELELTDHVKSILTPFKYPRWYEFMGNLPKTSTGKIQRYKLRKTE